MVKTSGHYLLSFDFRIFYCPETFLIGASKELNQSTLRFEPFLGNKDMLKYIYSIDVVDINSIVRSILMGKVSYLLSEDDMRWIKEFDEISSKHPQILNNEKYVFNYFVLKTMLIGFTKETAIDLAKCYFKYKREGQAVLEISKVFNSMNKLIDNKEFWITNKVIELDKLEIAFMTKILKNKIETGFSFDYKIFEREYVAICETSFSKENYKTNLIKKYPIKKIKNLQEQIPYILQAYEEIMISIINTVVQNKFPSLSKESRFLTSLLSDMKETLKITMSAWE